MTQTPFKELDVSSASEKHKEKILEYASDLRKFEIGLFWQRSLFFWGFIGAAFVAYADLHGEPERDLRVAVGCFGFVCSVAWTLQNYGSKYWQEAWEQKAERVEHDVLKAHLFSNVEPRKERSLREAIFGARRFSVSGLTTALSCFTVLIWIALVVGAMPPIRQLSYFTIPTIIPVLSFAWAILMWITNRRRDQ